MASGYDKDFERLAELLPLDSEEEIAVVITRILENFSGEQQIEELVKFVQASVEEALILRTPPVPLQRLGRTALVGDIRSIEDSRPSDESR